MMIQLIQSLPLPARLVNMTRFARCVRPNSGHLVTTLDTAQDVVKRPLRSVDNGAIRPLLYSGGTAGGHVGLLLLIIWLFLTGCDSSGTMMTISTPSLRGEQRQPFAVAATPTAFAAMSTLTPQLPQATVTPVQLAPTVERPLIDLTLYLDEGVAMTEITHTREDGSVIWRTLFLCHGVGWVEVYREARHHAAWWYEDYIKPRKSFHDAMTNEMVVITRYDVQRVAWDCARGK